MPRHTHFLRLVLTLLPSARPLHAQAEPAAPYSVSFPGSCANQLGGFD